MSKVLTFSTKFPKGHPKSGEKTFFVEKIWESIYMDYVGGEGFHDVYSLFPSIGLHGIYPPKHHTIRAGHRFKVGDYFTPKI